MARVFVYGTLKQGFRNFHVNRGTRLPGAFVTVEAFPLYVIGPFALPWLVHEPGRGERIKGQLFEVDDQGLVAMDVLERVADAHWYTRRELAVRPAARRAGLLRQHRAAAHRGDPPRTDRRVHRGPPGAVPPAPVRRRQLTSARSQSGRGADFCALKSVHTVLLPPSA